MAHHIDCDPNYRRDFELGDEQRLFRTKYEIDVEFKLECLGCCFAYLTKQRKYNAKTEDSNDTVVFSNLPPPADGWTTCRVNVPGGGGVRGQIFTTKDERLGEPGRRVFANSRTYQFYNTPDGILSVGVSTTRRLESVAIDQVHVDKCDELNKIKMNYADAALVELYREQYLARRREDKKKKKKQKNKKKNKNEGSLIGWCCLNTAAAGQTSSAEKGSSKKDIKSEASGTLLLGTPTNGRQPSTATIKKPPPTTEAAGTSDDPKEERWDNLRLELAKCGAAVLRVVRPFLHVKLAVDLGIYRMSPDWGIYMPSGDYPRNVSFFMEMVAQLPLEHRPPVVNDLTSFAHPPLLNRNELKAYTYRYNVPPPTRRPSLASILDRMLRDAHDQMVCEWPFIGEEHSPDPAILSPDERMNYYFEMMCGDVPYDDLRHQDLFASLGGSWT